MFRLARSFCLSPDTLLSTCRQHLSCRHTDLIINEVLSFQRPCCHWTHTQPHNRVSHVQVQHELKPCKFFCKTPPKGSHWKSECYDAKSFSETVSKKQPEVTTAILRLLLGCCYEIGKMSCAAFSKLCGSPDITVVSSSWGVGGGPSVVGC